MSTIIIVKIARKNICWKVTKMYLAHYKQKFLLTNKDIYNKLAGRVIELYRKAEVDIDKHEVKYTRLEFINIMKAEEKSILKRK